MSALENRCQVADDLDRQYIFDKFQYILEKYVFVLILLITIGQRYELKKNV